MPSRAIGNPGELNEERRGWQAPPRDRSDGSTWSCAALSVLFAVSFFLPVLDFGPASQDPEGKPLITGVISGWSAAQFALMGVVASIARGAPLELLYSVFLCAPNVLIPLSLWLVFRGRYREALLAALIAWVSGFWWILLGFRDLQIGYWAWLGSATGALLVAAWFRSGDTAFCSGPSRRSRTRPISLLRQDAPHVNRLWDGPGA